MRMFRRLALPLLLASLPLGLPSPGMAQVDVGISVTVAPPALPIYAQPIIPGDGYLWMPGYWAWNPRGYYWVPGTWVEPPEAGFLWTPGYWAWGGNGYVWHEGYWGPTVGFYGGINYGYGYGGSGYDGGYWDHDRFRYNTAANNLRGVHIASVYSKPIAGNARTARPSYNGGERGITAQPRADEAARQGERRAPPTDLQTQHVRAASDHPALQATVNHGRPTIAATPKPTAFTDRGVVAARGASRPAVKPAAAPAEHPAGPPQDHGGGQGGPPQDHGGGQGGPSDHR